MASRRARRVLSILLLLVWLPLYVVVAISLVNLFDRPPIWAEFLLYAVLGVLWALPFRRVFLGVSRDDPPR